MIRSRHARVPGALVLGLAILCGVDRVASAGGSLDEYDDIRKNTVIDVHALADLYFQHDFNRPPSDTVQLRAFDGRSDAAVVNFLRVTLAHRPEIFGFRIDAGVGATPDAFLRSDPAASQYPTLSRGMSYVEQAFVSLRLPVGRELSFDLGKFDTPIGIEDNITPTNWNYSHSLLFTFAEPTYHTGARIRYPLLDTLVLSVYWVNGWNTNILGGNGMRTVGAGTTWHPKEALELTVNYMGGPERAPLELSQPILSFRSQLNFNATYDLTARISFALTADYVHDASNGGVVWGGIGGYLRGRMLPWLAATARAESFFDVDGFATGVAQRVAEATGTVDATHKIGPVSLLGRLEYRRDQSDYPVFLTASPTPITRQDTLTLAVAAMF